jgi:hypothetical protein
MPTLIVVDFISQLSGALEGNDFSFPQQQILTGGRVAAAPRSFVFDTKFSETRHQHIIALGQRGFDYVQKRFDDIGGLLLRKAHVVDFRNYFIFR